MDIQAFNKTISPIKDKLFRIAYNVVGNRMEAEDVVQEVFIKLWERREKMNEIDNIEAWSIRVTKNLSIDKLRSKHNKSTSGLPEHADWVAVDAGPQRITEARDVL